MSERDPSLQLSVGGDKYELTPDNTTLYTFLGRTAIGDVFFENASANHVFMQLQKPEEEEPRGLYLFEKFHPAYQTIAQFAIENSFPVVGNHRRVPECDLKAYMAYVDDEEARFHASLEGVLPEDF